MSASCRQLGMESFGANAQSGLGSLESHKTTYTRTTDQNVPSLGCCWPSTLTASARRSSNECNAAASGPRYSLIRISANRRRSGASGCLASTRNASMQLCRRSIRHLECYRTGMRCRPRSNQCSDFVATGLWREVQASRNPLITPTRYAASPSDTVQAGTVGT